jgi:hypothetical protein
LRENIERKRLHLWRMKNWILHDDNAPSMSTPRSWVSHQPQHVIASASGLLTRVSSCRLLPFPKDEDAADRSPFSHRCRDAARITDYHTRYHKNTNITTPDVNTAMSLGTLSYQDRRSL